MGGGVFCREIAIYLFASQNEYFKIVIKMDAKYLQIYNA